MSGFGILASIAVQKTIPTRFPRRDFSFCGSDTPTLSLTVYQTQNDTAPLDISDASFALSLFRHERGWDYLCWDYGFPFLDQSRPIAVINGILIDPTVGRVDIPIQAGGWPFLHRCWYALTISYPQDATTGIGVSETTATTDYAQGNMTILQGIMDFALGPQIALIQTPELLGNIGTAS